MRRLTLRVQRVPVIAGHWQAQAHIVLGSHAIDNNGDRLLSPDCRSATEVRAWANMLIKELESITNQAAKVRWKGQDGGRAERHPNQSRLGP